MRRNRRGQTGAIVLGLVVVGLVIMKLGETGNDINTIDLAKHTIITVNKVPALELMKDGTIILRGRVVIDNLIINTQKALDLIKKSRAPRQKALVPQVVQKKTPAPKTPAPQIDVAKPKQ